MNPYVQNLSEMFISESNPANAKPMKKYMREQFEFFGIKHPHRRQICKDFIKKYGLPEFEALEQIVTELWEQPQREFHYFGIELPEKFKSKWEINIISLFEKMIINKSWWDTVDLISTKLVGEYFKKFPKQISVITEKWINSDNFWLNRTCILFQLKYQDKTDTNLLFSYINKCSESKEFFIQKAIGWALREYAKTSPGKVINFVSHNNLKPLSKREALKNLDL